MPYDVPMIEYVIYMLYIIVHTVSSNLFYALYRLIRGKKYPIGFPTRHVMLAIFIAVIAAFLGGTGYDILP